MASSSTGSGGDGKAVFRKGAERNRVKVECLMRGLMKVGSNQLPGLNAQMVLDRIHKMNSSIPSDTAHQNLVETIAKTNGWIYQPKPTGKPRPKS